MRLLLLFLLLCCNMVGMHAETTEHIWPDKNVKVIEQYVEDFRMAFVNKDYKFFDDLLDKDRLYIYGKVVEENGQAKLKYVKDPKKNIKNYKYFRKKINHYLKSKEKIEVKVGPVPDTFEMDEEPLTMVRKSANKGFYGISFRIEWSTPKYSEAGYIFMLWDFHDEGHPIIHVITWQPEYVGNNKLSAEEVFNMGDFDL